MLRFAVEVEEKLQELKSLTVSNSSTVTLQKPYIGSAVRVELSLIYERVATNLSSDARSWYRTSWEIAGYKFLN